jgi:hypothetical protein
MDPKPGNIFNRFSYRLEQTIKKKDSKAVRITRAKKES